MHLFCFVFLESRRSGAGWGAGQRGVAAVRGRQTDDNRVIFISFGPGIPQQGAEPFEILKPLYFSPADANRAAGGRNWIGRAEESSEDD